MTESLRLCRDICSLAVVVVTVQLLKCITHFSQQTLRLPLQLIMAVMTAAATGASLCATITTAAAVICRQLYWCVHSIASLHQQLTRLTQQRIQPQALHCW